MNIAQKKNYDIGVIIGRFQTNELHEAHKELIQSVIDRHKKVILFLGVAPTLGTKRNPLDFSTRKAMIEEEFGNTLSAILPIHDSSSDKKWSNDIDNKVREVFQIGDVVLYGSRDSFIPYYSGKFDTCVLEPTSYVSATDVRNKVSKEILASKDFRAGVIYGIYNTFPTVYSTVDIAILDSSHSKILLGRKENENKYRFIGGFSDVKDDSFETAAKREVIEETGLEVDNLTYVCSKRVKDWRYSKDNDRCIITTLFYCDYIFGSPQPNDDIAELKWFPLERETGEYMVEEHSVLFRSLMDKINN